MMIHILVTCYNCEAYLAHCLESIQRQVGAAYQCHVFDDVSTDGSVQEYYRVVGDDSRFTITRNTKKLWQVGNYHEFCRERPWQVDENDVALQLDGDDWFPDNDNNVLRRVVEAYHDSQLWFTWGSMTTYPSDRVCCPPVVNFDDLRQGDYRIGPLRTWKIFLWRALKLQDLMWKPGEYIPSAGDMAFSIPMLEMSHPRHARRLEEINYIYNEGNPISDRFEHTKLQLECDAWVRSRPRYSPLVR